MADSKGIIGLVLVGVACGVAGVGVAATQIIKKVNEKKNQEEINKELADSDEFTSTDDISEEEKEQ